MEDLYQGIADRYDLFFENFGEHKPEVVEFYRRLFADNGVKSVLDCACGTGRDMYLMHTLGCEVFGSDTSHSMLNQARKNLAGKGLEMPLKRVDYRELRHHYDRTFDAVLCLASSIFHMPDDKEALQAFKSMHDVLRKGGILVLSQGTTDKQWKEKPRFIQAINSEDFSRVFVIDYREKGARYNIMDIVHSKGSRTLKVWSVEYTFIPLRDDLQRLLSEAGFERVDFYGGYDFGPYDKETSDQLITVAYR